MNSSARFNCCRSSTRTSSQRLMRSASYPETQTPAKHWVVKLGVMPELQEMEKLFLAELDETEEISWSMPIATSSSSLWQECSDLEKQPPAKPLVKGKVARLTEQQKRKSDTEQSLRAFKKPLMTSLIQTPAVLPECSLSPQISSQMDTHVTAGAWSTFRWPPSPCGWKTTTSSPPPCSERDSSVCVQPCLVPRISSPEQEKPVRVAPECADDPGLPIRLNRPPTKHAEQESLGDFNEPLETRFTQNAAVLPKCCIRPQISSPGRETLISVASDAPGLLIHGRSVAEYQQLYHSVVDVLVKRKEHMFRSEKIKKRLWDELSGPHFRSSADTQQQLAESSCTDSVYTAHKEFDYLRFYN